MFGRGSSRKELFADETPANALTDDKEHLADLVGVRGFRALPSLFVSTHVRSDESRRYVFVTSVLPLNSTAQCQQHQ
jgi:hypothetical protein